MRRLVLVFWLAAVPPVYSWGVTGHALVARLAAARLSPKTAATVAEILGPDETLTSVSSWADRVRPDRRETGPWHYVDIQITDAHLDMKRDCPDGNCVLVKIEEFQRTLKDRSATPEKRKEALMFLVHFIGDLHQPLHCADNHNDRGGNNVAVTFFGHPKHRVNALVRGNFLKCVPQGSPRAVPIACRNIDAGQEQPGLARSYRSPRFEYEICWRLVR